MEILSQIREAAQEKINAIYEWEIRHPRIALAIGVLSTGLTAYYLYRHNHFGEMISTLKSAVNQGTRIINAITSGSINFPSPIK